MEANDVDKLPEDQLVAQISYVSSHCISCL